ncbi:MAG: M15 family metallopeptidase [Candidatus Moraniibacteriota bacterium]
MTNLIAIIILFLFPVESNHLKYQLPTGYQPAVVVTLSKRASFLTSTQKVDVRINEKLEQLINNAEKDGLCLSVSSGYRSFDSQQKVYDEAKDKSLVMKAGLSEHQTGLAVDLQACPMDKFGRNDDVERPELAKSFDELPEYVWLVNNAVKYNISQSYSNEPWHWKFNIKK